MTALAKVKDELFNRALSALDVFKNISELNKLLEDDKIWFRDQAHGEKLDIEVPGIGKVQVKTPSPGKISTSTVLDVAKFEALDQETKHKLVKLGVVTVKQTSTAPSKASVVFTLNV